MAKSRIKVFYAHRASEPEGETKAQMRRIYEHLSSAAKLRGAEPKISIISGRSDFQKHFTGDWDRWTAGVSGRKNAVTNKPLYGAIVVPSDILGRATASIVEGAITRGTPVFLLVDEETAQETGRALQRITEVYPYDPDDWTGGFRCA